MPRIIGRIPWAVFVIRAGNLIRLACCPLRPWKKHWHGTRCWRAGATPRFTWAAESRKSGVAPAQFRRCSHSRSCLLCLPKSCAFHDFAVPWVKKWSFKKVQRVTLTFFTVSYWRTAGRSAGLIGVPCLSCEGARNGMSRCIGCKLDPGHLQRCRRKNQ